MKKEILRKERLKEAIHQSVAGQSPTVEFEKIWKASQNASIQSIGGRKKMSKKKIFAIAIIAATLSVTTLSAQYTRKIDDITYTFQNDSKALGAWTVVDFVKKESDFKPGEEGRKYVSPYLRLMDFQENGQVSVAIEQDGEIIEGVSPLKWSKEYVIHEEDKTNSKYTIKEIDGKNYMFYEWKSGDYIFRGQEPYLYVLEQGRNVKTIQAQGKVDNTDIPFENDEMMKGTWVTVDYVQQIKDFKPDVLQTPELWLEKLVLAEDGAGMMKMTGGERIFFDKKSLYWTKGAIVDKINQNVSKCIIKQKKGETYIFYQYKGGNYTVLGLEPGYMVLRKQK